MLSAVIDWKLWFGMSSVTNPLIFYNYYFSDTFWWFQSTGWLGAVASAAFLGYLGTLKDSVGDILRWKVFLYFLAVALMASFTVAHN
jgi:hypothetical protein